MNNQSTNINEYWKDFEQRVLDPVNAPPEQRSDMKRAFFSGAGIMLHVLTNVIADLPEDDGVKLVESLVKQLSGFGEAVKLDEA